MTLVVLPLVSKGSTLAVLPHLGVPSALLPPPCEPGNHLLLSADHTSSNSTVFCIVGAGTEFSRRSLEDLKKFPSPESVCSPRA